MWLQVMVLLFTKLATLQGVDSQVTSDTLDLTNHFNSFKQNFNRTYTNSSEHQTRFEEFKQNMLDLLDLQKKHGSANFGMTKFMDWTKEEKAKMSGVYVGKAHPVPSPVLSSAPSRIKRSTPTSFSWQSMNKVTPVKDQKQCGCCWAFASVAVMETAWAIKNSSMLDLSEQNLISCVTTNYGCNGGYIPNSLVYERATGIATEAAYPFTATNGSCHAVSSKTVTTDWWLVGQNESQLTTQLSNLGALVYLMWVPNSMFYLTNTSGVYKPNTSECQTAANNKAGHAVTVVGYGTDSASNQPYWLIKNSWGTSWGNAGFFKLYRGANICSIGESWYAVSATSPAWTCTNAQPEMDCKNWQYAGYCNSTSQYYSYMSANCKAVCGLCASG